MPVGDVPALPPPHSRSCVAYVLPLSGGGGGEVSLVCVQHLLSWAPCLAQPPHVVKTANKSW